MTDSDKTPKVGRPSDYRVKFNKQAYRLCLLNATDVELANFFEVSIPTLNAWKKKHPKFLNSIKEGKDEADANVADRLYNRAMGYSHPEFKVFNNGGEEMIVETTKHHPPDATSAIFWLKNRQPQKWRDRKEVVADVKISELSEEEINKRIKNLLDD